jgi:hypothetical protein
MAQASSYNKRKALLSTENQGKLQVEVCEHNSQGTEDGQPVIYLITFLDGMLKISNLLSGCFVIY